MVTEFRLPELGENIETGGVINILVSVGDVIGRDQPVLEVETDKAAVEVPSSVGGRVKQIHIKQGDTIEVGQLILTLEESGAAKMTAALQSPDQAESPAAPMTKSEKVKVESEPHPATAAAETEPHVSGVTRQEPPGGEVVDFRGSGARVAASATAAKLPPAAPSVRRLAREIGVDINEVPGSGPGGRISQEDVKKFARRRLAGSSGAKTVAQPLTVSLPDFAQWGEVERKPMTNVRRVTARNMAGAWSAVPHVTQHDKANITDLETLRKRYANRAEAAGGKLTVTVILLKLLASALKLFPQFNASLDIDSQEIIYKRYYHIGVAVDTERGLLVPVIRDVDQKNIPELAVELTAAAERARNRKTALDELQGGTFTMTNLGGIGGTSFTPIVNAPQVAILGVSRGSMAPVFIDGQFEPRLMLPLSLSYDHRLIDGADAARFLRWLAEALEHPFLLWLEG